MALTFSKIDGNRREPAEGNRRVTLEGPMPIAGAGVDTQAHSSLIVYRMRDGIAGLSIIVIGVDGAVIPHGNFAGHLNSNYEVRITNTNIEIEVPVGQTNVSGQTCRIWIEGPDD